MIQHGHDSFEGNELLEQSLHCSGKRFHFSLYGTVHGAIQSVSIDQTKTTHRNTENSLLNDRVQNVPLSLHVRRFIYIILVQSTYNRYYYNMFLCI